MANELSKLLTSSFHHATQLNVTLGVAIIQYISMHNKTAKLLILSKFKSCQHCDLESMQVKQKISTKKISNKFGEANETWLLFGSPQTVIFQVLKMQGRKIKYTKACMTISNVEEIFFINL